MIKTRKHKVKSSKYRYVHNDVVLVMHQVMTDTENYQSDKNNNFSLKASTYIIMSITALPIKLTEILVIMSVSIFKTAIILYLLSHYMKQFIKYQYYMLCQWCNGKHACLKWRRLWVWSCDRSHQRLWNWYLLLLGKNIFFIIYSSTKEELKVGLPNNFNIIL